MKNDIGLRKKKQHFSENIFVKLIYAAYWLSIILTAVGMGIAIVRVVNFKMYFSLMPISILILIIILPPVIFIISTKLEHFEAYGNRKMTWFRIVAIEEILAMSSVYLSSLACVIPSLLTFIDTTKSIQKGVIVVSAYVLIGAFYVLPLFYIIYRMIKMTKDEIWLQWFDELKYDNIFEKKDKEEKYKYNLTIIKNLETGKDFTILEEDRKLHTQVVGSTGTGKTAMTGTPSFESDMRIKAQNEDVQKKMIHEMCERGEVVLTKKIEDRDFNINYFIPKAEKGTPEYDRVKECIESIKYKYKNAGATVFCPNEAYTEELYDILKSKGIKCNRLDPRTDEKGNHFTDFVGFNPLYVRKYQDEREEHYLNRVYTTAQNAAEVNQAVYEILGTSDPYFSSLNTSFYIAAAMVMMIGVPLIYPGTYAKPSDVQNVINNFARIEPYRNAIVKKYGVTNQQGRCDLTIGKAKLSLPILQPIIDRVDLDFLGQNSGDMARQASGLRNIIDATMSNDDIRNTLCCDNTVDWDIALEEGQVTLVNFEISLGNASTNFGLYVLLNFITAAFNRPGTAKTRIPHFVIVDEAARLLHPKLEPTVTLTRQYGMAWTFIFQSLDQFDKLESTRFLKNVFAGNCAHQIIFGRASLEEMRYFEEASGMYKRKTEEFSMRYNSLTDTSSNKQMGVSYKNEEKSVVAATDIRYRDFKEVTVMSVKKGAALPPFLGRMNFLPENKKRKTKRLHYDDWNKYFVMESDDSSFDINNIQVNAITEYAKGKVTDAEYEARKKELVLGNVISETQYKEEKVEKPESDNDTFMV